ncbi:MAG TPA: CoA transferase [Alphaproteobacteria bacterium]|nr:CoA transferase [Alphaproteobacteria bacterium]
MRAAAMPQGLPLAGVRVLAVEQYGAGPFGSMFLADQGAEVIKIENPHDGGDMARGVGPHFFAPGDSQFFHSFNRNKKSLTLDLTRAEGQEIFRKLVTTADAVACNLRGDVHEKLGLTYDALKDANPAIVCAHLSAYGRTGPRADWPGFDYLMQAETGWMTMTGEPDGAPARCGLSIVDMMTGLAMSFGLLSALTAARATGQGRDIDVSLFDLALHNLCYLATWQMATGEVPTRLPRSAHPSLVPCQLYPTADGWIFIMCNKEKFWPILCDELDRPEWKDDPRFVDAAARLAHRDTLNLLLDEIFRGRSTGDWLAHFDGRVPAAPIYDVEQALANPFVAAMEGIDSYTRPDGGSYRMVAPPVRTPGVSSPKNAAPQLGADTDDILAELGFDKAALTEFRKGGIV